MYKVIAIFGKSCSGKDTLLSKLDEQGLSNYNKCILKTTRPKREKEKDGVDYVFITEGEASKCKNAIVSEYNGWKYILSKDALVPWAVNVGIFNLELILKMKEDPEIELTPVFIFAPDKVRLKRGMMRYAREQYGYYEMCRRFCADEDEYKEKYPKIGPALIYHNYSKEELKG